MATTVVSISDSLAVSACNLYVDALDLGSGAATGSIKFYTGTAPARASAALSGNTLLGTCLFSNPAFGNAAGITNGAQATANAITDDTDADATGTATFYRTFDRDGNVCFQGSVGVTGSGESCELATTSIVQHATIHVTSMTFTQPEV